MPDKRRASDVPDSFRRQFIKDYRHDYGTWPRAMETYQAWESLDAETQARWIA